MKLSGIVVVGLLMAAVRSEACAPIPEENAAVRVMAESAVIVWDEKNQTQHFIRSALFDGEGKSLGFVVPTPSVPRLARADSAVFGQLETLIKPKIIYKTQEVRRYVSIFTGYGPSAEEETLASAPASAGDSAEPVEVVGSQRIGDYDSTILRATNARDLGRWLDKNGYNSSRDFEKWLDVYIQKRWYLTAFKIAKVEAGRVGFTLAPVRISFQTPRPFYPYREPRQPGDDIPLNVPAPDRSLRVFFFAPHRMQAVAGTYNTASVWPAQVKWADKADSHQFDWQAAATSLNLSPSVLKAAGRLTVFEDTSSPRPGTDDVFFQATQNQQTLPRPIVIVQRVDKPVYVDLFLLAGACATGVVVFVARRRKRMNR